MSDQQQTSSTFSGGDVLDRAVDSAGKQAGHDLSNSTDEKISDGVRAGYKSATGNDVPIQDKEDK